jgi:hypothetical protein
LFLRYKFLHVNCAMLVQTDPGIPSSRTSQLHRRDRNVPRLWSHSAVKHRQGTVCHMEVIWQCTTWQHSADPHRSQASSTEESLQLSQEGRHHNSRMLESPSCRSEMAGCRLRWLAVVCQSCHVPGLVCHVFPSPDSTNSPMPRFIVTDSSSTRTFHHPR